jgi:hypothetical protein
MSPNSRRASRSIGGGELNERVSLEHKDRLTYSVGVIVKPGYFVKVSYEQLTRVDVSSRLTILPKDRLEAHYAKFLFREESRSDQSIKMMSLVHTQVNADAPF